MTTKTTPFAATSLALLALGALAGCATTGETATGSSSGGDTGSEASDAPYTDGTYEAEGSYQSPDGTETIEVTITLEGDTVTAVEVVGNGDNPDSKRYQGEFIDGIAGEVVGKDIDDVSVDRVGGSSLTSGGFMSALADIKAQALA